MRYKINNLLNNIKIIRMDNLRINNEKNKLIMKITNLESVLDLSKNLSFNELEERSNIISQLNEIIMNFKVALSEKENKIKNIKNDIKYNKNKTDNINKEKNTNNEITKNNNMKDLINQINILKKEKESLRYENEKLVQKNKAQNSLIIDNRIKSNYDNYNNLIEERNKISKFKR